MIATGLYRDRNKGTLVTVVAATEINPRPLDRPEPDYHVVMVLPEGYTVHYGTEESNWHSYFEFVSDNDNNTG